MRITATLQAIPDGIAGTKQTLKIMGRLVDEGKKKLPIRLTALSIVENNGQKDYPGEIKDIFNFVKNNIRYVKDVRGVETLQLPEITLQLKQGDCDDKAVLLASLLESIGHQTRFKAIGFTGNRYSHVFVETKLGNTWIPLDTTENVSPGWKPNYIKNMMIQQN